MFRSILWFDDLHAGPVCSISFAQGIQSSTRDLPGSTEEITIPQFVIATTAAVIGLAYYTTQVLWVAIAAGSASFFFVGAIRYSRLFKDSSKHGRKGASTAVGLWKGFLISAILSSVLLGITILVVLTVGIAL